MTADNGSPATARRNRMIAMAAGAITVIAIVVAFAGEYFELPWKWLRPGVELLLLAELVGLVVLERHQLFEPVSENVIGIQAHIAEMREAIATANLPAMGATLAQLNERVGAAGQVTVCNGAREVLRTRRRLVQEIPSRGGQGPLLIRTAVLSGRSLSQDPREVGDEMDKWWELVKERLLLPSSPSDSAGHNCSFRLIMVYASTNAFNVAIESIRPTIFDQNALNFELKVLTR